MYIHGPHCSWKIFSDISVYEPINLYIILYILSYKLSSRYWVFRSWGRVGTTIGGNKLHKFTDKRSAMDNFLSVYEEKTGNNWGSSHFTKYPNKFYPLEIDYGQVQWANNNAKDGKNILCCWFVFCATHQDEEAVKRLTASAGTNSKLPKPVQDLIKIIFDVESMKKAMVEFEVRLFD